MRICLVNRGDKSLPGKSSIFVHIHKLAEALVLIGHEVDLIAPPSPIKEGNYNVKEVKMPRFLLLKQFFYLNLLYYGISSALLIKRLYKEKKYDVIYFDAIIPAFFSFLLSKGKIPLVMRCGFAVSGIEDLFIPPEMHRPKWEIKLSLLLHFFTYRKATKIIAGSERLRRLLITQFRLNPQKVVSSLIVGVDTNIFNPEADCSKIRQETGINDKLVVCSIARVAPYKNQLSLIKAAPYILERFPEVRFLTVGPVESTKYYSEMKRLVHELSIEDKVHFIGFVEHNELPHYYNLADIYVLLSTAEGGGPVGTLAEAMACGRPIVASSIPQNKEAAVKGDEMLFVNPLDVKQIAKTIISLLENRELRMELGKKARKTAVENFTWNAVAERTVKVFAEL